MKKTYEEPVLVTYGSVEELTQGGTLGHQLDAALATNVNATLS